MDWAYVVDSSDSVDWNSWRRYILENAQRYFKVNDEWSRVGLITYSDRARIAFPFTAAEGWDVLINRTPQQGGSGRRVDLALQVARDDLFTPRLGARTDSRKVTWDVVYATLDTQIMPERRSMDYSINVFVIAFEESLFKPNIVYSMLTIM